MHTGYFGKVKNYPKDKEYKYISIARFNKFWTGETYLKLFPPVEIIKIEDEQFYTKLYYEKVLNKLDPKQIYAELGDNSVLLCYEKWADIKEGKTFCHRRIVAKRLEETIGVKVEELDDKSKNNIEQLHL